MKKVYFYITLIFVFSVGMVISFDALAEESLIPDWIKNTANFWANNQISDSEFLNALQYLVKEGFLEIPPPENDNVIHSYYAEQETREISSLSQDDIEGLLTGSGTPFGGMALVAELNSHPGPRHVLDAANAGELELTDKQYGQIQTIFEEMRSELIELGKQIIDIEREMDDAFENGTMTEHELQKKVSKSAELYGKLRLTHLKSHLSMMEILTPPQVEQYDQLRGYTSDNPCENVPEGHDPEMWKLHHNCK